VGRRIEQIELPKGARIGAIVRGTDAACELLMPYHDLTIQADDHVIIFLPDKRMLRAVEKLFQVSATFF
jgi:trk system potassium uptake protein TrkA